jgi:hypothetical protein
MIKVDKAKRWRLKLTSNFREKDKHLGSRVQEPKSKRSTK